MKPLTIAILAALLVTAPALSKPEDEKPTVADLLEKAERCYEEKRYEEEREAYRAAILLDPDCTTAHGRLAMSNYTSAGGSIVTVVDETRQYLLTSPHREYLKKAIADWEVYGNLRKFRVVMAKELEAVAAAVGEGKPLEAAEILENAADGEVPDAYRTVLYTRAGNLRRKGGDGAGARRDYTEALGHPKCKSTIDACIGLAILDVEDGNPRLALDNLRFAVDEGSGACRKIADLRKTELLALFESEDRQIRRHAERHIDEIYADAGIRAELNRALEKAGKEGKRVLLMWYGPYCPYVMAIEERMAHPQVRKILDESFVLFRMDQGSLHRGVTLEREFGDVFMALGVPSFFVLDPDGSVFMAKKDAALMDMPHRSFCVERISAWLAEAAPKRFGFGEGVEYDETTLLRFKKLVSGKYWRLTYPPRNPAGLLVAAREVTGLRFLLIPGGTFEMGSEEGEPSEAPVHAVTVAPFLLCETERTGGASLGWGLDRPARWDNNLPKEGVSREDADRSLGGDTRLPSEAEWEYACRAGTKTKWYCGDEEAELAEVAWHLTDDARNLRTHPVATLEPNAWGLYDMHGNVREWVADSWHKNYVGAPTDGSAWIEEGSDQGVSRGGSWLRTAYGCRSAYRHRNPVDTCSWLLGFRPAASLPE